ncbi:UDP-glucuronosyltransferase 1-1 [Homalodisca vitripennis]|nr:UDP-glucuronosyltransferase 1-1 [Homalodisca vitripennis]
MESLKLVLLCLLLARSAGSARILVMQVSVTKSHSVTMEPLFEELAARGHHLTVFTSSPHKSAIPNMTEIDLSHKWRPVISNFSLDLIKQEMSSPFKTPFSMTNLELRMCENVLASHQIQSLLASDCKFDLVISETFTADCFVPLARKFNAPLISFVTSNTLPWGSDRVGLPDNPAYIPNYLSNLNTNMTLYQRIYNFVLLTFAKFVNQHYAMSRSQNIVNKYFSNFNPPLGELIVNTSLLFVNTHFSLGISRPVSSNVVEVGGIHMRTTSSQLSMDIQQILDQSSQGVILVSFGSLIRISSFPRHMISMFLQAFSTISLTIILKYEDDLPEAPPNVVIRKWIHQKEIIGHKNVKAFLNHGGMGSIIETVYYAKPIIGIPLFADQHLNVKAIAAQGAGVLLEWDTLSEKRIRTAINNVLNDSSYTENMRRISEQFRDRPMTPLQTAVYWTEYVIRHQGAPHLRPASVNLPLYKYLLLDVIAVMVLPFLVLLYSLSFLYKKITDNKL